jgi:hypothetical protein
MREDRVCLIGKKRRWTSFKTSDPRYSRSEGLHCSMLGYDTVQTGDWLPTLQRNLPPPLTAHLIVLHNCEIPQILKLQKELEQKGCYTMSCQFREII